jgi:hypothetical protein
MIRMCTFKAYIFMFSALVQLKLPIERKSNFRPVAVLKVCYQQPTQVA